MIQQNNSEYAADSIDKSFVRRDYLIRVFDFVFSLIAIVLFLPFMTPIIFLLKLTGEHYIFYRQNRIGRYGKEFRLYKFATMLINSPNLPGGLYTSKNDPRLLPMGRILRKLKINELPQLLNIFMGQMSIIGYRPTVREHFNGYPEIARRKLFNERPGLAGLGSLVFRNEEEILHNFEDKKSFHQNIIAPFKASLECWYVDNKSLYVYFMLIILTAYAVIRPSSKAWRHIFRDLPPIPLALKKYLDN